MAIKFVDVEPEKRPARPVELKPKSNPPAEPHVAAEELPFAKSEPKPKGRKKPLK